jgi:hypothetical protein
VSDLKLRVTSWGEVALDKRQLKAVMRAAGNDVRSKTAKLINQSSGAGRTYAGGGGGSRYRGAYVNHPYTASAAGDAPVRVSGTLRQSLKTYPFKSGEGFAVRARIYYALFLEVGAFGGSPGKSRQRVRGKLSRSVRSQRAKARGERREMEPRPFLDRVMAQEQAAIDRRVHAALTNALTWKQTK